jgi:hypothetical protein
MEQFDISDRRFYGLFCKPSLEKDGYDLKKALIRTKATC